MDRRVRHTPRIGVKYPERRKALFDRRQAPPILRFAYGVSILPLRHVLHAVSLGRIPLRASED